jgi:hypothetical protein
MCLCLQAQFAVSSMLRVYASKINMTYLRCKQPAIWCPPVCNTRVSPAATVTFGTDRFIGEASLTETSVPICICQNQAHAVAVRLFGVAA